MNIPFLFCRSNIGIVMLASSVIGSCAKQLTEGPSLSAVFTIPPGFSDTVIITITNTNPNCTTTTGGMFSTIYPDLSQSCRVTFFDVTDKTIVDSGPFYATLECTDTLEFSTVTQYPSFHSCSFNPTHVYQAIVTCLQSDQTLFTYVSPNLFCS